jgi:hypothetical protein
MGCIKLQRLFIAKETRNGVKKKPIEWKKICATSDRGLISKNTKNSKMLNIKQSNQ